MKAILVKEPKSYHLVEMPKPHLGDGAVLVRVRYCGICASDFEILYGLNEEEVVYPIIPGHEWSGEVVEAGKEFAALVGKRVTGDNVVACGKCLPCLRGHRNGCGQRREIGFSLDGAYADYVVVPGRNIIELPADVEFTTAVLAEPLAVPLHALRLARMEKDQKILIVGDGPIGLLAIILARHLGAEDLMIAGHHQGRLDRVAKWTEAATVNTHETALEDAVEKRFGSGPDLVLETTGRPPVVSASLRLLGPGGTLCLVGAYRDTADFRPNDVVLYEQNIIGSLSYIHSEIEESVRLLGQGLVEGMNIVTHVFPLEQYARGFDVVEKRRDHVIKACLET